MLGAFDILTNARMARQELVEPCRFATKIKNTPDSHVNRGVFCRFMLVDFYSSSFKLIYEYSSCRLIIKSCYYNTVYFKIICS